MEEKEFIQVSVGNGGTFMISKSSISFVQPLGTGARITMKESAGDQGSYYIDTITGYYTIKTLIEKYPAIGLKK